MSTAKSRAIVSWARLAVTWLPTRGMRASSQHRAGGRPPGLLAAPVAEPVHDPLHQRAEPAARRTRRRRRTSRRRSSRARGPPRQRRLVGVLREPVLEVQVEHEAERTACRAGRRRRCRRGGPTSTAPHRPLRPSDGEDRGGDAPEPAPVARELPGEVLPVVAELGDEVGLPLRQRRLAVLDPIEHVAQRLAEEADRLALVDRRELRRADRQAEVVERDPDHHGEHDTHEHRSAG